MQGELGRNEIINRLNEFVPSIINQYAKTFQGKIHLVFSKKEHTYEEHLIDLIDSLERSNIYYIEKEYFFTEHSEVGRYFLNYINDWFKNKDQ